MQHCDSDPALPTTDPGRRPPADHDGAGVTQLLARWRGGDPEADQELAALVYDELHTLAERYLRRESKGHTLQPTALVHEAYIRLVRGSLPDLQSRSHLLGVAARLMRQILVNHAEIKNAAKRGRGWKRLPLDEALAATGASGLDFLALDEALTRLGQINPRPARVVELRYFGGLTIEETAEALGISARTVVEDWAMARAWLFREMSS